LAAWPRSGQYATAALLLLTTLLFTWHGLRSCGSASRPTELRQGQALRSRIDLNQARRVDLVVLPGVGEGLAQRIVRYREEHGGFRSVDDLRRVQGVGPTLLARLRPLVRVQDGVAEEESGPAETLTTVSIQARQKANTAARPAPSAKSEKLTSPININRATAAELQTLPGIGPKLAQRVLDERAHGRFKSVDDLRRVAGIGVKTLDRLRPYVTVESMPVKVVAATSGDVADKTGFSLKSRPTSADPE
jgi:competence protein ComEA